MHIDALSVLCAQLTRDLLAIAKFLLFLSELCQITMILISVGRQVVKWLKLYAIYTFST